MIDDIIIDCSICKGEDMEAKAKHLYELHQLDIETKHKNDEGIRSSFARSCRQPDIFLGNAGGPQWYMAPHEVKWLETGEGPPPRSLYCKHFYQGSQLSWIEPK
jgi:hypothetical protein